MTINDKELIYIINEIQNYNYLEQILYSFPELACSKIGGEYLTNKVIDKLIENFNNYEVLCYYENVIKLLFEQLIILDDKKLIDETVNYLEKSFKKLNFSKENNEKQILIFDSISNLWKQLCYSCQNTKTIDKLIKIYNNFEVCLQDNQNENIETTDRIDKTDANIFSIDITNGNSYQSKRILDDAFSVDTLPNGNKIVSLHIADVDAYVKENSSYDLYAKNRGMSFYSKYQNLPMLPYDIAYDYCSLTVRKPKLAITINMELDNEANLINTSFEKSIITNKKAYTDEQVKYLVGKNKYPEINELYAIAEKLSETSGIKEKNKGILIVREIKTLANKALASYAKENNIPFIYKNKDNTNINRDDINRIRIYLQEDSFYKNDIELTLCRPYYSNICTGYIDYNNVPYCKGTVPIRSYSSLEILRIIKEIIMNPKCDDKTYYKWEDKTVFDSINANKYEKANAHCSQMIKTLEKKHK